jgi:hypothetical protein
MPCAEPRRGVAFSAASPSLVARTMSLPRPDPDDRYEPLWGLAAALPPSLLLCGVVLLVLAMLG